MSGVGWLFRTIILCDTLLLMKNQKPQFGLLTNSTGIAAGD